MLDLTGEIAIARGRLATMLEQAGRYSPQELLEAHRESDRLYLDLQELVLKARMVPIGRAFQPFARTLRDLCAATGKLVRLEVSGEDVEVDTTVVELIRDPLTHLIRNAVRANCRWIRGTSRAVSRCSRAARSSLRTGLAGLRRDRSGSYQPGRPARTGPTRQETP
jgi:hypothetical protein